MTTHRPAATDEGPLTQAEVIEHLRFEILKRDDPVPLLAWLDLLANPVAPLDGLRETQRALGVALDRLTEYVVADRIANDDRTETEEDVEFIREARPLAAAHPDTAGEPGEWT